MPYPSRLGAEYRRSIRCPDHFRRGRASRSWCSACEDQYPSTESPTGQYASRWFSGCTRIPQGRMDRRRGIQSRVPFAPKIVKNISLTHGCRIDLPSRVRNINKFIDARPQKNMKRSTPNPLSIVSFSSLSSSGTSTSLSATAYYV